VVQKRHLNATELYTLLGCVIIMKPRDWNKLTSEQKKRLIATADSLGIPPNMVAYMYENYQINLSD